MRDNSRSPSPPPSPSFSQTEPLLRDGGGLDAECPPRPSRRPSTASSQRTGESWLSISNLRLLHLEPPNLVPELLKPRFRGFEEPSFLNIAILTLLCLVTYPAFRLLTVVAKNRSLSVVRAIVSAWCWGAGFAFGWILLRIGAKHLEAASEFALVGYRSFLIHYFKQPGPR